MIPLQRSDDLVVEHTDTEVLVYDLRTDAAHHLDAQAAFVWEACDGVRDVEAIAGLTALSTEVVTLTVASLVELELVEVRGLHSRRDAIQKSLIGAGVLAASLPVIKSIAAPEAAQAATKLGNGAACTSPAQCASGICTGTPKVCG